MTNEEQLFSGGVAVITGAGAGIGMGFARRCGEIGMTVVVTDIDEAKAQNVAAEIVAKGGKAEALRVDVSKPEALDALAQDVFDRHGAVRVLINNAGIETIGNVWEIPTARWEATLNINIHGVVHGCRAFIPHMLRVGQEAWIANLASIGSFGIMPTQTAYIMSKHAIQSFSECLYLEMQLAKAPINVCSIIPGMLKTSIFDAEAGKGEPESAAQHRATMAHMMANYGMELDEGCRRFVEGMAERKFWISSQPEMTDNSLAGRIAFFQGQEPPALNAPPGAGLGASRPGGGRLLLAFPVHAGPRPAAVNLKPRATDVGRRVRAEEHHGIGDVTAPAHAAQRQRGGDAVLRAIAAIGNLGVLGLDQADDDRIDPHFRPPFLREADGQAEQARLGRPVDRRIRRRPHPRYAGDVDDRAVRRLEMGIGGLGHVKRGQQVELEDAFGKARARGRRIGLGRTAGVVHHQVDPAMPRDDRGNPGVDCFGIADVAGGEPGRPGATLWRRPPAGFDCIALGKQALDDRGADAAGAAGDHRHLARTRLPALGPALHRCLAPAVSTFVDDSLAALHRECPSVRRRPRTPRSNAVDSSAKHR